MARKKPSRDALIAATLELSRAADTWRELAAGMHGDHASNAHERAQRLAVVAAWLTGVMFVDARRGRGR